MDRVLAVLSRGGIPVQKLGGKPTACADSRLVVPLEGSDALLFESQEDVCRAVAWLAAELSAQAPPCADVMLRVLNGTYDENDPACHAARLDVNAQRCVIVLQSRDDPAPLERALGELFPQDGPDAVVAMSGGRIALVKRMEGIQPGELNELCLAILDTVRSEAGMRVVAGIGGSRERLTELADSYAEALSAIRVGRAFHPREQVFLYRAQLIERFLSQVPEKMLKEYNETLFNEQNERLLNEEMLQTIECLFNCNLNLSETARRMFIHRNTLVYRLDKLQKALGLDLRKLDDAVVFKLLRMMGAKSRSGNRMEEREHE